jgi:hypothetical protein
VAVAEVSGVKAPLQLAVTLFVPLADGTPVGVHVYGTVAVVPRVTVTLLLYVQLKPESVSLTPTVTSSQSFGFLT